MITIYKSKKNIPQSMELIELNDYFFNKVTSGYIDERAETIIKKIDKAAMHGKYKIVSGLNGVTLDIDKLSSGCKTALNILYFPDKVFQNVGIMLLIWYIPLNREMCIVNIP